MMLATNELCNLVNRLIVSGAIHIKRGFRLSDVPKSVVSNHLLEEAVELQAEVMAGTNKTAIRKEAADTFLVFIHLLDSVGVTLEEVAMEAVETLKRQFTFDPEAVTAVAPGFTRSARVGDK